MIRFFRSLVRRRSQQANKRIAKRCRRAFIEPLEDRRVLTLVLPFLQFDDVDWTSAAVGGIGKHGTIQTEEGPVASNGSAEITIDGVSGVVTNAYLVWQGIDQTAFNGNGNYDNSSIVFNGVGLGGNSVGINDTAGWGNGNSQAYVADVTSHVTGSGTYSVDNLSSKPGHSANGVSLIVIYDDGDSSNDRDLTMMLGNQSRITHFSTDTLTYNGGDIKVQLHAADGQAFPDGELDFTAFAGEVALATFQDTTSMLDGTSAASAGLSRASNGDLWDVHNFDLSAPVNSQFNAGADLVISMDQDGGSDSLKWVGFFIDQPSDGSSTGNQPPTANSQSYAGSEDTSISGQLSGSDPEGDTLSYAIVQAPQNGQLTTFSPISGRFVYRPNNNFFGTDTFTYNVSDGTTSSVTATVTLNLSQVNDAPIISDQSFAGTEETELSGTIAAFDLDGDQLSFSPISGPSDGSLTLQSTGAFTYTPDDNFAGTDSATVSVTDGQVSSQAVISFNIAPRNDAPVAVSETIATVEDGLLNSQVSASDADGDALTYTLVDDVSHGSVTHPTLTFRVDGTFTYRPPLNFNGSDSFTFTASDGVETSNIATITFDVQPVNDRPSAAVKLFALDEDSDISDQLVGTDVDGDALTFALTVDPANGTATVNADGTFTYTPDPDFFGIDTFKYSVFDGAAFAYNDGTARFSVANISDAPVAEDDSYEVPEDGQLDLELPITEFSFVSEPGEYIGGGQTLSYDTNNANFFVYHTSTNSYIGIDVRTANTHDYWRVDFAAPAGQTLAVGTYTGATRYPFQDPTDPGLTMSGQHRGHNTSIGEFTITQANYGAGGSVENFAATFWQASYTGAPRVTGDIKYNFVDGGDIGSVLFNDSDADGDDLSAVFVSGPQHGTLSLNADGTFSYTPDADFSGVDEFTYRASDGTLESDIATVSINVIGQNDLPIADNSSITTDEDTTVTGQFAVSDVDGDQLSFQILDGPANGTVEVGQDNNFRYVPDEDYSGSDTFTFVANDGSADSNVGTVEIAVTSVNDAPVAGGFNVTIDENTPNGTTIGMVSASDVDSTVLTFEIVEGSSSMAFAIDSETGEVTVADSAQLDFETTTQFTIDVQVSDGDATGLAQATVDMRDLVDTIDIDVNDDTNTLLLSSKTIRVAILSTASFDATTEVDVSSLTFGATGDEQSLDVHKKRGPKIELVDVDGDGLLDLIAQFKTNRTGLDTDSTDAVLKGMLEDGTSFEYSDEVEVQAGKVKGKGKARRGKR